MAEDYRFWLRRRDDIASKIDAALAGIEGLEERASRLSSELVDIELELERHIRLMSEDRPGA